MFIFPERKKWSQPIQMNLGVPTARAAHAMCTMGRNVVIFGGRGIESRLNDLHIFNTGLGYMVFLIHNTRDRLISMGVVGAGCSSEVDLRSWGGPIELFLVPASAQRLV